MLVNIHFSKYHIWEPLKDHIWKAIGLTTSLHEHHAFLYISLPLLHGCDLKVPNFTIRGGKGESTRQGLSFPELRYSLSNSTPEKVANIRRTERDGTSLKERKFTFF